MDDRLKNFTVVPRQRCIVHIEWDDPEGKHHQSEQPDDYTIVITPEMLNVVTSYIFPDKKGERNARKG